MMPTGKDVMQNPQPIHDVRPSPIANEWYPGDPEVLAKSVDAYIARAEITPLEGRIMGILVPHAGHQYSGPVAGYAFKFLQGLTFDVVALVGPSHYRYPAQILTSSHDAYETPLGRVPVDRETLDALRDKVPIEAVREDPGTFARDRTAVFAAHAGRRFQADPAGDDRSIAGDGRTIRARAGRNP